MQCNFIENEGKAQIIASFFMSVSTILHGIEVLCTAINETSFVGLNINCKFSFLSRDTCTVDRCERAEPSTDIYPDYQVCI